VEIITQQSAHLKVIGCTYGQWHIIDHLVLLPIWYMMYQTGSSVHDRFASRHSP